MSWGPRHWGKGKKNEDESQEESVSYRSISNYETVESIMRIPAGCRACGGEYPYCKDSCPMFDD